VGANTRDAELVREYLESRDLRCFDELVAGYRDRVMRLVLSVLGPELANDAEDVVQETFLRAHDRLESFRGQSLFGSWLYRVAYNRALDHRRMGVRRERRVRDSVADPTATSSKMTAPAARLIEWERDRAIHRALTRVPQPYQTTLRAFYWLDLPLAEIAELLGVAPGTVKSYLHRGRARLARQLEREGFVQ